MGECINTIENEEDSDDCSSRSYRACLRTGSVGVQALAGSVTTDFSLFANGIFNQTESPVALGSHAGINAGLIKGRYFLQDNIALRLSLGLNNSSSTQKTTDPVTEATTKSNVFTFGLGLEHHFGGTDRLSPYIGAELFLGSATGSMKSVNSAATTISKECSSLRLRW